jgi:protocatechuate 3,4-dioxygenase beta subunit
MSRRLLIVSIALIAAAALRPTGASAQSVLLRVLGSDTEQPIFGALAHLVDDVGRVHRSVLTDERGRALFVSVPPARYRVRAEMIGMATQETAPFDVVQGATEAGELRLDPRPIDLEGIDVSAERRRCTARPSAEGLAVAVLWDEARKALSAAALTEQQGLYRYETMLYERDMDPESRLVLREDESRRDGYMRTPFESLPPDDLVQGGFVRRDGTELVYYAPDANVLLSDAFLDTHCFRLAAEDAAEGVVGLNFEPTETRRRITDVSGTLWLDRETTELRWLEYTYWNLDLQVRSVSAGGRVEFQRMPAGTWIVPEWWIEMPIIGTRMLENGQSRAALTRLRRTGGRVVQVHEGGGRSLGGRAQTGGIEGVVVDSAGAPMSGARVGVVGSNQAFFTDAEGRFGILGLSEGNYQVRFADPRLESFGLVAPLLTREVLTGEVSYVEFHMPSVSDLLREACLDQPDASTGASLVGRVVDEAGQPLQGVSVRVTWSSMQALGSSGQGRMLLGNVSGLEVVTSSTGAFTFCGVPRGERLDLATAIGGEEASAGGLTIAPGRAGALHDIRRTRATR